MRPRLTYANVVSTLGLFIVLGGTSYAVATNSIGTKQIKNNSIRSKDIRNNDVRSSDVRNGSLLTKDFKAGQLPAGPQGPKGDSGPSLSGLERVHYSAPVGSRFEIGLDSSDSPKTATATCPAGKVVIGTGATVDAAPSGTSPNALTDVVISGIVPTLPLTIPGSVMVTAIEEEPTSANWGVTAYAICANPS